MMFKLSCFQEKFFLLNYLFYLLLPWPGLSISLEVSPLENSQSSLTSESPGSNDSVVLSRMADGGEEQLGTVTRVEESNVDRLITLRQESVVAHGASTGPDYDEAPPLLINEIGMLTSSS